MRTGIVLLFRDVQVFLIAPGPLPPLIAPRPSGTTQP